VLDVRKNICKLRAHGAELLLILTELGLRFIAFIDRGSRLINCLFCCCSQSAWIWNPNSRFLSYAIPKMTITSHGTCQCAMILLWPTLSSHSSQKKSLPPGMKQFSRGLSVFLAAVWILVADFKAASLMASWYEGSSGSEAVILSLAFAVLPGLISDPRYFLFFFLLKLYFLVPSAFLLHN